MAEKTSIYSANCVAARSGAFVIAPEQAMALNPRVASALRITCGKAWVTLGDGRDHILLPGQTLHAAKGSRVVIEPISALGDANELETVYFDWDPVPMRVPKARRSVVVELSIKPAPQRQAVSQAWGDFRVAFAAGLLAATRLVGALLGLAARARSAHSNASRAQGRMASCESMASSGAV